MNFSHLCILCGHRHWWLLFWTIISRMFLQSIALKIQCLPPEQRVGLLWRQIISPSRADVRQVCFQPTIQDLGSLRYGFLRWDTNPLCPQHPPGPTLASLCGSWRTRESNLNMKPTLLSVLWATDFFVSDPRILCLLPAASSPENFGSWLVSMQVE